MDVGVAIIYYNPNESVLEQMKIYDKVFKHILVIDNSDSKKEKVVSRILEYTNLTYVDMEGNKGMSIALNYAFKWAREQGLDYILTMDQDSEYPLVDIEIMLKYIEKNRDKKVAVYGANFCKLYWDKKEQRAVQGQWAIGRNEVCDITMCLTSGSYVNVSAVQKILPLKDYFIALVDNFMSEELIEKGFRLVRVGASGFRQQVGEPVAYTWLNQKLRIVHLAEIRYYYMVRNNCFFCKTYKSNYKIFIKHIILMMRFLFNIVVGENEKWKKIKACFAGYIDFKHEIYGKIPKESITW